MKIRSYLSPLLDYPQLWRAGRLPSAERTESTCAGVVDKPGSSRTSFARLQRTSGAFEEVRHVRASSSRSSESHTAQTSGQRPSARDEALAAGSEAHRGAIRTGAQLR